MTQLSRGAEAPTLGVDWGLNYRYDVWSHLRCFFFFFFSLVHDEVKARISHEDGNFFLGIKQLSRSVFTTCSSSTNPTSPGPKNPATQPEYNFLMDRQSSGRDQPKEWDYKLRGGGPWCFVFRWEKLLPSSPVCNLLRRGTMSWLGRRGWTVCLRVRSVL